MYLLPPPYSYHHSLSLSVSHLWFTGSAHFLLYLNPAPAASPQSFLLYLSLQVLCCCLCIYFVKKKQKNHPTSKFRWSIKQLVPRVRKCVPFSKNFQTILARLRRFCCSLVCLQFQLWDLFTVCSNLTVYFFLSLFF